MGNSIVHYVVDMKQTLEKIINSTKDIGKRSWKFVKDHAKESVLLAGITLGGYFLDKTMSVANADTIKIPAYINDYSLGSGEWYESTYIGHYPGESIHYGGWDSPYLAYPSPGVKIFSESDGVELSLNNYGVDEEGFNTPHVLKVELEYNSSGGGVERYRFYIYGGDWSYIDDKIGVITKDRVGVNARDPNNPATWNNNNQTYKFLFRDIEGQKTDFGTYAPQNAGPLTNIHFRYHSPQDFNLDGVVGDYEDLEVFADNWLATVDANNYDPTSGLNEFQKLIIDLEAPGVHGDGIIDFRDFAKFANGWLGKPIKGE